MSHAIAGVVCYAFLLGLLFYKIFNWVKPGRF